MNGKTVNRRLSDRQAQLYTQWIANDRRARDLLNKMRDAIKAARAAAPGCEERAGRLECRWQREQLPDAIRELVLDDQRLRNDICWSVFDC